MESIQEIIVVEGRDDVAAVKRAVEAEIIATHGFGISKATFARIGKAYETKGIIILTDPDFAGETIRKRLTEKFPDAKHAYLPRQDALKNGDIGVENASPEHILEALQKCHCRFEKSEKIFSMEDLVENDLVASESASSRRDALGRYLGIGYCNAKIFLSRINSYGITRDEFNAAISSLESES